jgi:hypothetical protein
LHDRQDKIRLDLSPNCKSTFCFGGRYYQIRHSTKQHLRLPTVCAKHVATLLTLSKICHKSQQPWRTRKARLSTCKSRNMSPHPILLSHIPNPLNTPSKPFLTTHKLTPAPFLTTATSPASAPPQTASSKPKTTPPSKSASAKSTRRAATPARTRCTRSVASCAAALRVTTA